MLFYLVYALVYKNSLSSFTCYRAVVIGLNIKFIPLTTLHKLFYGNFEKDLSVTVCRCLGQNIILTIFSCQRRSHSIDNLSPRPEGRPDSSDVSPLSGISGLSFDSIFLSAPLSLCPVQLLIQLSSPCCCFWPSLLPTFHMVYLTFVF